MIGGIQTRATKLVKPITYLSYQEQMQYLKLPSMLYRRKGTR